MKFKDKEDDIKEIINALYNCYLEELEDEPDILDDDVIAPFEEKYHKPFDWTFGATKLVLIFKDLGFVIKIPFRYSSGVELNGAKLSEENWNYCEQESILAKKLIEKGFGFAIAETELLTCINGYPIYIQPYANILLSLEDTKKYCHYVERDLSKVKSVYCKEMNISKLTDDYDIDFKWHATFLSIYGEEKYDLLIKYINLFNIYDLRSANIGYMNNNPVLVDYASFNY